MYTYSFEKLEVWHLARQLVKMIYKLTENFPNTEKFGLTSQIRRAAVSVASHLAEGSCRKSKKDSARFTEISFSSLIETLNQLIISVDLDFLTIEELDQIRPKIEELTNKLNAYYNAQEKLIR